jgi:hypothetical protein
MNTSESNEALYKLIEGGKKEEDFKPKKPIGEEAAIKLRGGIRERKKFENLQKNNKGGGGRRSKKRWSRKYKKSINCRKPKGFSQKQYCKFGRRKKKTRRKK